MNFASDNWAGAHPHIAQCLVAHAEGYAPAYGASDLDRRVEARFAKIFGRPASVFFLATGTAANSLAMTALSRPGGVAFCHREAHMIADECGAPEYFSGGARLHPVDGPSGKIDPEQLERAILQFPADFIHAGQPMAVSITQASEIGTVYTISGIKEISAVCKRHGLPLHMDGARFANALAALDVTPAEMTIDCGVDVVSFGGTKNGCWCAEALVFLNQDLAGDMPFLRKRAAQLFSKSRFIAAQFDTYLEDGLWLDLARHANAMAARLAGHIENSGTLRLAWKPDANEVFAVMDTKTMDALREKGAVFYPWHTPRFFNDHIKSSETLARFVTSYATLPEDVDRFGDLI